MYLQKINNTAPKTFSFPKSDFLWDILVAVWNPVTNAPDLKNVL